MFRWSIYLLAAVAGLAHAPATRSVGPVIGVSFDGSGVEVVRAGAFTECRVPGLRTVSEEGAPSLPYEILRFVIPGDARVEDVVVGFEEELLPGVHRVRPAQAEVPIGAEASWVEPDASIYGSDDVYPSSRVRYLGDGYLGGYRIASVAVYPLTYAPSSGRLFLATDISVELRLGPDADRSQARHRVTASSAQLYRDLVAGLVENPGDVSERPGSAVLSAGEVGDGFSPRYTPSLEGSAVEYVIVTSDELAPYFQELADWKTRKGVPAVVRTVSWIDGSYPGGCDTAERVRMFIQDAYATWGTTYVLIGGDTGLIPTRTVTSDYYGGWELSTDLYYSDLDGNWNGDGDSVFGEGYESYEVPGDSVDLYPDVFVGRAPASDAVDAETFVDKTLAYEKTPSLVFSDRNLYMAEVLFPYDWEPGELISSDGAGDIVEPSLLYLPPEIHTSLLYQNYTAFPESHELGRAAALDSLDRGYNIAVHVGHGNKDVIRTSKDQYIMLSDASALANGLDRSGFLWMFNCTSAAIDYDCIAERFVNNTGGGATWVWGPTHYCFPTSADEYFLKWFERFHTESLTRAGVICAASKTPFVPDSATDNTDRWTQMTFLLLGDPEARLLTGRPKPLTVVHEQTIPLGAATVNVSVTDPAPVDSALVCIAKDGEVYASGHTDPTGQISLQVTPATTGSMTITVSAQNHLPYEDAIGVLSSSEPHLSCRSFAVDDDASGGSDGNGNAAPEAGETIELDITVGNGGLGGAVGVTAEITTLDPYVAAADSTEYLGDLPGGSVLQYVTAFSLSIDDDCPNEHEAGLTIEFTEAGRATWSTDLVIRLYRPQLVHYLNDIDDGVGGNGIPDNGETITLTVEILNDGNGEADEVAGVLRYPSGAITITDSVDTWGDMLAGSRAYGADGFEFVVNSGINDPFELELSDEDGKTWVFSFDLERPTAPPPPEGSVEGTTIRLAWPPVAETDLWGYNIYRTDHPAGTYMTANDAVIEGTSYFEDSGLDENTRYYYRIRAIDTSANESEDSATLEISTNPPSQSGWPLLGGEGMYGTPAVVDLDLDGDLELLVGSGEVYCWHHTGAEYHDGDGDPRTNGVYSDDGSGGYRASLAVGQLDGDLYPEIVAPAWANVGTEEDKQYEIFAWNSEDGSVLPGWPVVALDFCWATPALGDLDHDGLDEVVVPAADGNLYVFRSDGTELIDGDGDPLTTGIFTYLGAKWTYGSPAIVDIDDDHELEILVPSRSDSIHCYNPDGSPVDGWPVALGGDARTSVVTGDVDNDGGVDVVVGSSNDNVWLLSSDGTPFAGWPKTASIDGDFPPTPSLADLNGDDDLEIVVVGSDSLINVWTWEGDPLAGWPQAMAAGSHSSAAIGDIDQDSDFELVTGCDDGRLYAYDPDGTLLAGWPIQTGDEIYSSATIADLDLDGDNEVILSGMDAVVYVWDTEGAYAEGDGIEWATFRHSYKRNGYYDYEAPVGIPETTEPGAPKLVLEQNVPNPFRPSTDIAFVVPTGAGPIELAVYNIAGRRIATLMSGEVPPGPAAAVWDGRDDAGRQVAAGVYFVRLAAGTESRERKVVLLR